jgi:hypothetical protein
VSSDTPAKVAMPATVASGPPPLRMAPLGPVLMTSVTVVDSVVAMLLKGSARATCTAGLIVPPAMTLLGPWRKMSWVAGAVLILNESELALVRPAVPALSV